MYYLPVETVRQNHADDLRSGQHSKATYIVADHADKLFTLAAKSLRRKPSRPCSRCQADLLIGMLGSEVARGVEGGGSGQALQCLALYKHASTRVSRPGCEHM